MATATARLRAGDKIVAQVDHYPEILYDMSITDADGNLLKGIQMIGKVVRVSSTHVTCELKAAEETLHVPLSMVSRCAAGVSAPNYYVVVNEVVKEVPDLLLPEGSVLPDYHTTREGAEAELAEIIKQNPRAEQVVQHAPTEEKVDESTPATQAPPPSTPAAQVTRPARRSGRRARARRRKSRSPVNDNSTASDTPNESEDSEQVG